MKKIGLIIFLFGFSFSVTADTYIQDGWHGSKASAQAACAAAAADLIAGGTSVANYCYSTGYQPNTTQAACTDGLGAYAYYTVQPGAFRHMHKYCKTAGALDCTVVDPSFVLDPVTDDCVAAAVPEYLPGTPNVIYKFEGETAPAAICHNGTWHGQANDNITMQDGDGNWLGYYSDSGTSCTPDDVGITETNDNCITSAAGVSLCLSTQEPNCGYYNDIYGCAEDIPQSGICTLLGDGGYICVDAVPPVGTAEPPETALGTATNSDGDTGTVFTQTSTGAGSGAPPFQWSGPTVSDSPFADLQTELDAAKLAFSDAFGSIGTELETAFSANLSTGASYTCDGGITVHGWHIEICILPYLGALSILGLAIIFMATWTAITIVMET